MHPAKRKVCFPRGFVGRPGSWVAGGPGQTGREVWGRLCELPRLAKSQRPIQGLAVAEMSGLDLKDSS